MNQSVVPGARPARAWSIIDVPAESAEDGPVALLRSIASVARRHWRGLALWVVICTVAAAAYARTLPPVYTAAASLLLEPKRQIVNSGREVASPSALDLNRADSEIQVIRSERLLALVFDSLDMASQLELQPKPPGIARSVLTELRGQLSGLIASVAELLDLPIGTAPPVEPQPTATQSSAAAELAANEARRVAFVNFSQRLLARRVGQSYVVEIAYSSSNPVLAARVANAAVSAYLLQSVAFKAEAARSGAEFLQGRLDALSAQVRIASDAVKTGTLPEGPTPDADARVIGAALAPLGPSAPRSGLITALGGVLGLLSGCFFIVLASAFDRRIRSGDAVLRETGLSCFASVPEARRVPRWMRRSHFEMGSLVSSQPDGAFAAAIRDLRTSVALACPLPPGDGNRVIAMVSWAPAMGCSMLCMNFARLMQRSGKPVTVIDADIHAVRQTSNDTVMADEVSLVDILSDNVPVSQVSFLDLDGIALLPATFANAPSNYFVDFRDPKMAQILAMARARGDVLLDLPPLSTTADARALAAAADAVVIVVRANKTTFDELKGTVRSLRSSGANVIGVVINRMRP